MFVFAHMDDETILSYGTMAKLVSMGSDVMVLCMCGNGRLATVSQIERFSAFKSNMENLGVRYATFNNTDLSLTRSAATPVASEMALFRPELVVTHFKSDLHFEHRLVYESVFLSCRTGSVKTLLTTTSSATTYINGETFRPNFFIDITESVSAKKSALEMYSMELPADELDPRSPSSVVLWNRLWGRTSHVAAAEPYELVFDRG